MVRLQCYMLTISNISSYSSRILSEIFQIAVFLLESVNLSCSVKKVLLRKYLWQNLSFNKIADPTCSFIKKETLAQVISYEFCKSFKSNFFTKHLWVTASVLQLGKPRKLDAKKTLFAIFLVPEAAIGGVLYKKVFLEVS